jgi:hypothetical protein
MTKDPNTIYLFLSPIGKEPRQRIAKAKDNQGKLNSTSSSSVAGACKAALSEWDRKGERRRVESYQHELTWWTTKSVRSCHLLRVPQLFH